MFAGMGVIEEISRIISKGSLEDLLKEFLEELLVIPVEESLEELLITYTISEQIDSQKFLKLLKEIL